MYRVVSPNKANEQSEKESMVLRPEGTAGVMRSLLNDKDILKGL